MVVDDGKIVTGVGRGEVLLDTSVRSRVRLKNVLYVPEMATNLMSGTVKMNHGELEIQGNANGLKVKMRTEKCCCSPPS